MSSLSTNAHLYARLAVLRQRIMFRYAASRIVIGTLAVLLLLVGVALLNVALFLALRNPLGDIGAVLGVAAVHLVAGAIALAFTLQEPASAELEALSEAEAVALDALSADTSSLVEGIASVGGRFSRIGSNASLAVAALSSLQSLLSRTHNKEAPK
ncbi:MAG: hypothetical protein LCH61_01295 [Proteobacteria bacterium]|nr:hypothetical protein [Pseudomonadota bacterium]MCA0421952.1 hypothetical protein [Pseudomonadota bacterium]